ncbi:nitrile hydratase accessory protein [Streptomyces sp. NPDC001817]|uniref:nitrile hydratase accessory protein n=1 Tax=Streptomyces sp. NPDC001817 TaxID=3154398 RepID=UPI00332C729D
MNAPLGTEGPAAPPRSNGELLFAEPWESRACGMAVTLYEAGVFGWPEFQTALIARITAWTASGRRSTAVPTAILLAVAEDAGLTTAVQIPQAQVNKAGDTLGTIRPACAPRSRPPGATASARSADVGSRRRTSGS